ncbi:MAG TPA: pyruvate dehydrogenase (acetyl-transferring) E1 component subunit alpha, partial [Xanthobacteraceae bacterium]|nr:pyruvate dehydrogenase (acetyl-transferring) E1 component subunit alpha [Xanthobacteraceae bacterium]
MAVAAKRKPKSRPDEPAEAEVSAERLLDLYRRMLLIRRFEEKAGQMYGMGL